MTTTPAPITPFVPVAPDADWETVRARMADVLTRLVPTAWSDHNAADPGITLAEAAAFGVADLHYRVAERHYDAWPLEVSGWLPDAERHWDRSFSVETLAAVADALAASATSARVLERRVRASASLGDATALLGSAPWSTVFDADDRAAVVALMRGRLVRQVAHEQAQLVAAVVADQRRLGGTVEVRDARAAAELALDLPLWDDEVRAVVRRERRRLSRDALVARLAEVRAVTAATASGVRDLLDAEDLTDDELDVAMAAGTQPPGLLPEQLEDDHGRTTVWPPHPVQALTCEPVTAEDYARRARAHPDVRRAWAVPGRLEGVAWNGLPTGAVPAVEVDEHAAAITLVVEHSEPRQLTVPATQEFLRDVLSVAIGPEVRAPFPDWRVPADLDELPPRRTICDEVGASLLDTAAVIVQATLVTGIGVDPDALIADVRDRIAAFFLAGRPETRAPDPTGDVDGPWPRLEQPADGWVPGEPVRFTEVVAAIVGNPDVWGIERLAMLVDTGDVTATFVPQSAGSLPIPPNAVPVLAPGRCLRVRFSLTGRCADA
ncbi:hypothetical protein [Nocardioides conyzicola]|uniref:DUF222 domain-containing protein n=1 Tax=Nocardioides conyzicola TaxID=1651781 RepID=A0ABP8XY21_9ACTN